MLPRRLVRVLELIFTTSVFAAPAAEPPPNIVEVLREKGKMGPWIAAKAEFRDIGVKHHLVDLPGTDGKLPLQLEVRYTVLTPAPIVLKSTILKGNVWKLCHLRTGVASALEQFERIDLSQAGEATWSTACVAINAEAQAPAKGLVCLLNPSQFRVAGTDDKWIRNASDTAWWREKRPLVFQGNELTRKLTFTLADLSDFSLAFDRIESSWKPGRPLCARLTVTDADNEEFPVVNVSAVLHAGRQRLPLVTEIHPLLHVPTGWLTGALPEKRVPRKMQLRAEVSAMTRDGPVAKEVVRTIRRGRRRKTPSARPDALDARTVRRNAKGMPRETRALWVSHYSLRTRAAIAEVVERAARARLNVLVPCVYASRKRTYFVKSDLYPISSYAEEGLDDPLATMISVAHERGLEVHPWFCVTYRDQAFRDRFRERYGVAIDVEAADPALGKRCIASDPADLHRQEYRDWIVELILRTARDYDVDGIHLDYIRSMGRCYCARCKLELEAKLGKPLEEATEDEWTQWQRAAVADIVRRTAEGVKAARPAAIMSAAVVHSGSQEQGQDPVEWARQGWIDVVIPMDYGTKTFDIYRHEKRFVATLDETDTLAPGLCLYWRRDGRHPTARPPTLVSEQIRMVRELGVTGYVLFSSMHLDDEIIETLRDQINPERAAPWFR